jgi:uncharacterized membrane protein
MKPILSNRHLAKTISWRVVGTLDTLLFSFLLTGDMDASLSLSGYTVITKMIWYYLHERAWLRSSINNANSRHLIKTFTWRSIGTLDTILISYLLTGNAAFGLQIGGIETITKMVLYYFHEKLWYRINFGLDNRNRKHNINE